MEAQKIYRYRDMLSMPRGIEMKGYYHGDGSITYIGQYLQPNGQPNARPKRVYEIRILKNVFNDGEWSASILEDNENLVRLGGPVKWNVAYAALGVLKGILHKRCCQTSPNRAARKRAMKKGGEDLPF